MPDANPWDKTFRRIRAVYRPECVYPPLTTAAELDAAEKDLGVRLPASYRAFAERFGLGGELHTLPVLLPLVPPPGKTDEEWWCSVTSASRHHRAETQDPAWVAQHRGLANLIVLFALDANACSWAFDPWKVTYPRPDAFRGYELPRFNYPVTVAESFHAWLEHIDQHYRFGEEDDEDNPLFQPVFAPDATGPNPIPYERRPLRKKDPPDEASVSDWLRWHNGTILALARSIRDGQRDAFGILADALEDAGCRNPDLLHSCRHGDPAIDGVWALRVLLGE